MTPPRPDGSLPDRPPTDRSRDRRIEEPSNLWLVHPLSRALLPAALRAGVSANAVSAVGLAAGAAAAAAFGQWRSPAMVVLGLALAVAWLVLDGLDGMVARATGTASPLGRLMDGLCDHGAFLLLYLSVAASLGTAGAWALAVAAGAAHAVQSSYYEGERARYHRRVRGERAGPAAPSPAAGLVAFYDRVAGAADRAGAALDRGLERPGVSERYAALAAGPMRLLTLLSANTRVQLLALACFLGNPRLWWWAELTLLPAVAVAGFLSHRRAERAAMLPIRASAPAAPHLFRDHVH